MITNQLVNVHEEQNYFVYVSNRSILEIFPILVKDPHTILNRAHKEIGMGYSTLIIYERVAVLKEGFTHIIPSVYQSATNGHFKNLVFVHLPFNDGNVSYSAFEQEHRYASLQDAISAGNELIQMKKKLFPNRTFTIVCSKLLATHAWH